ncbi:MAG: LysR family transcriptional regulator [Humidesulfovibrio sp.]|uniref:LysR family transcriptional regulator n=1 Tax=Humidesulfovibrio sp. TaxID=2910988 RepID=UPI002733F09A|nr:LysR family transcriptional regulator [Humidesulfovibrio sp.]MDP2846748.1 LysR family transcriptional regulator [Humidesulfovibrio sp.]
MSFDLTDLRLFLHIVDSGSITKGAERSHLALASASARIRNMEDMLGVQLLTRGRRGVTPTEAGRALQHHGRIVLDQWVRMLGDLGEYASGLKGHIRLLCNTASLTEFLPDLLTTYLAEHPNVSIELNERPSTDIAQDVVDGKADVGVMARSVDVGALETFPFRKLTYVLATPMRHELAERSSVSFSEVLKHDFVGLNEDSPLQRYLESHAARLGREMNHRVRLRGFLAVGRMVERNVGVAIMPDTAAQRCKLTMNIRTVRITDPWVTRDLILCMRRFDDLPVHVRDLVEMLRQ